MNRPAFSEPAEAGLEIPIADLVDLREARSQAVSPDGAMIAFLSNASGLPQIWRCDLDGTNMRQLTDMPERVVQFSFSPKNRDLLLATDVGMDERHQLWLLRDGSKTPQGLTTRPDAIHKWGAWSPCGTRIAWTANDRDPYVMDAVVMDLETARVRRVRQGTGFQEVLAWTKDGEQLILRDSTRGTADQDLLLLTLASGETRPLPPRAGRTIFQSVKLRGDGAGAFVLCDRGRDFHAVHGLDFADGNLEALAAIDGHDIDAFALTPDQTGMALAVNHDGFTRLMVAGLGPGPDTAGLREIALPFRGLATTLNYTPDGVLLATLEGPARPASIWRCDPADGIFSPVTPPIAGKVDLAVLALPETARCATFDGAEVPYLVYPPRGDRPAAGWPVLFIVHGGPEAQWVPHFHADVQHCLSRGIMVVAPNVRGSTGYGRPYHEADDVEKRMDAVQDLLALARIVAARPDVDAARIGIMGRSYGGFMTLAALTEAPELWRTGIDVYGISNFTTLMETTGPWRRAMRAAEYGHPERDAAFLAGISPVHALDRVRAPLLVVHCTDDPRVPIEQGEQVYSRLRGLGRPVDILRVEHEGHGFSRITSKQKAFGKIAEWLAKTL